jgi:signal transduction histidine kinase
MFDTLRIFFLSLSFIPYLILERKRPVLLILGILPTLFSFLFFNYLLRLSGVPYDQDTLHTPDYQLMGIRSFTAYVILNAGCFAFQAIIADNDLYNQKLVSELKNKSVEIEQQNKILLQKQSELNEINQHLEELVNTKTHSIKRQNEMLMRYSYTNAHKLRGPLARILGLIQVSRLKTDLNFPWFFEKVEEEAKGIDTIINSISNELSNVENESTPDSNNDT